MKDLLFYVLRLLLQLLIFVITGRWPAFLTRRPEPTPAARQRQPRERRTSRASPPPSPAPTRSWSYSDGGEPLTLDALPPPEGGSPRPRSPRASSPPLAPTRSLGRALRDRGVLRDALTLDAALGSRPRRR